MPGVNDELGVYTKLRLGMAGLSKVGFAKPSLGELRSKEIEGNWAEWTSASAVAT